MSVKRKDIIIKLEQNRFSILIEGGNHAIYTNDEKIILVKRYMKFKRITADNEE